MSKDLKNINNEEKVAQAKKKWEKQIILIGIIFLFFIFLFAIIMGSSSSNSSDKTEKTSYQNQSNQEQSKTIAFMLASLEVGHNNPSSSLVNEFDTVLDKLEIKCPDDTRSKLGDYIYIVQTNLKKYNKSLTLLQIANGINESIPEESIGIVSCAEVGAAFVALMVQD